MEKTKFYVPEGYKAYLPDITGYNKELFTCFVSLKEPYRAIFYIGRRSKPGWHYSFSSIETMKREINETISRLMSWEDLKRERRQSRVQEVNKVRIGQLYSYSWGYDQTNIDFYMVVDITKSSVKVVSLGSDRT
jgi:hypothetical protein